MYYSYFCTFNCESQINANTGSQINAKNYVFNKSSTNVNEHRPGEVQKSQKKVDNILCFITFCKMAVKPVRDSMLFFSTTINFLVGRHFCETKYSKFFLKKE